MSPEAESQAPAPSEPGDDGVAPIRGSCYAGHKASDILTRIAHAYYGHRPPIVLEMIEEIKHLRARAELLEAALIEVTGQLTEGDRQKT